MAKKAQLVTQYLERINAKVWEDYQKIIGGVARGRPGIYALFRKDKLYYVGLATNLKNRLKTHLKDRHTGAWDSFSVYLTIGDSHLRELESLFLRMFKPKGNKTVGKFAKAEDLRPQFKRRILTSQKRELDNLFGWDTGKRRSAGAKGTKAMKGKESDEVGNVPLAPYQDKIPGRRIKGVYKKKTYWAVVRKDGRIRLNGKVFVSPSAAGTAARNKGCNGWRFWTYQRSSGDWVRLEKLRK
jgi:hypothetical protein